MEKSFGGNIILACNEDQKLVELFLSLSKEKSPFVAVAFVEVCDLNHHLGRRYMLGAVKKVTVKAEEPE